MGCYDALTGVVRQPMDGMKKEGWKGMWKGVGMGVGELILNPIAGKIVESAPHLSKRG